MHPVEVDNYLLLFRQNTLLRDYPKPLRSLPYNSECEGRPAGLTPAH